MWRKSLAVLTAAVLLIGSVPVTSHAAFYGETGDKTENAEMQEQSKAEEPTFGEMQTEEETQPEKEALSQEHTEKAAEDTGDAAVWGNLDTVSGNETLPELPEPIIVEDSSLYTDADAAAEEAVEAVERTLEAGISGILRPYEGAAYSLTYRVNDSGDGITITGITDYVSKKSGLGRLVIPDKIEGLKVTEIGAWAFYNCRGFSGELILPKELEIISMSAFDDCTGFTGELVLPEGLAEIGSQAFLYCSGFSGNLEIPAGVTEIGRFAFDGCWGFNGELVLPEGLTKIGQGAFKNCNGFNGELVLPEELTEIGEGAFKDCYGFTGNLVIPDGVTTIGDDAFSNCRGLTELPLYKTKYSLAYYIENDRAVITGIKNYKSNLDLGELVIPETIEGVPVTKIGRSAFSTCSGFSGNLEIPAGVTEIGPYAFGYCTGFTGELVLPEGLTEIGEAAFRDCYGFTGSLKIPDGVTTIGDNAFSNCRGLTELPLYKTKYSLAYYIENNRAIITGIKNYKSNLDLGELVIPETIEGVPVTAIGEYAFAGCGFTGNLKIPAGVTAIGNWAFTDCKGFSGELVLPEELKTIGGYAFCTCGGFSGELALPEGLAEIGEFAFGSCSGLTGNLEIPSEMTRIGGSAFYECSGLLSVIVLGKEVSIDERGKFWNDGKYVEDEYGVFGPINRICGYPGSTAQAYAETNNCTFIPLTETAAQDAVEFTSSVPGTDVTVPMQEGAKLSLLSSVLADRGLSDTAEETALEITVAEADLQGADRQMVDSLVTSGGMTAVQYMDISMKLRVGSEEQEITRTPMPVRFVVDVPRELQQEGRRFSVVRLHDGQTQILEDLDSSPSTVTIETDCFSPYTLVYRDGSGAGSLTGTAVSFPGPGGENTETVLVLKDADGTEAARTTVAGAPDSENKKLTGTYCLEGLAAGTYTLQASRDGHTTREYTVTITQDSVDAGTPTVQDVELWLRGDVSGDGKITALDKKLLFNHMAGAAPLSGYALSVGDVSGDGKITALDKKLLFNHMAGTTPLW